MPLKQIWQVFQRCFFVSFDVLSDDGFPFRQKEIFGATWVLNYFIVQIIGN